VPHRQLRQKALQNWAPFLSALDTVFVHIHNAQRLLKTQNPRIAEVNVDDLVDNRFIRKLDESGFFERVYSNAGR